jgi:hypothetical protein
MKNEAKRLYDAGLIVIPTKDKAPHKIKSWLKWKTEQPTQEEFDSFSFDHGIGVVCGNGIFCIDIDTKNDKSGLTNEYTDYLRSVDKELMESLYYEKTVNNGIHIVGRTTAKNEKGEYHGNVGLCKDDPSLGECIETREQGGYFVCAPTKGYRRLMGDLTDLPTITDEQYFLLMDTARAFSKDVPKEKHKVYLKGGTSVLDDYDAKHNGQDSINLLLKHGWTLGRPRGGIQYLRRPDKNKNVSATYGATGENIHVFSTSTIFEANKSYSPMAVLCYLEYNKDFKRMRDELEKQGYGKKGELVTYSVPQEPIKSVPMTEMKKKLLEVSKGIFQKGLETGWDELSSLYRVSDHQLTIVTGIPTHGKSTWVDHLFVNLASFHNWKFLIFSPESYPPEVHWRVLAEKFLKRDLYKASEKDIDLACSFLESHFELVDCSKDDITLDQILALAKEKKVNGLLIDPWNELEYDRPKGMSETDHIGYSLKKIRTFSRNNKIATWVVAHPQKQYKDEKGNYKRPTLYDIAGSAHWYNKADNGVIVFREEDGTVKIFIDKVKFRYYGKKGEASLSFNEAYRGYDTRATAKQLHDYDLARMK